MNDALIKEASQEATKDIIKEIRAELESRGINAKYLALKFHQGLNAMVTRLFAHEGIIKDKRNLVDLETRRKYLDMLLKQLGAYPNEKYEIDLTGEINMTMRDKIKILGKKNES